CWRAFRRTGISSGKAGSERKGCVEPGEPDSTSPHSVQALGVLFEDCLGGVCFKERCGQSCAAPDEYQSRGGIIFLYWHHAVVNRQVLITSARLLNSNYSHLGLFLIIILTFVS